MNVRQGLRDVLAGLAFVVFGLAFAAIALTYQIGTTLQMGPGYFPLVVGGMLAVLGAGIVAKGLIAGDGEPVGVTPWKALVLILGAVLFFGLTVRGLGLVPTLLATVILSAFAGQRTGIFTPVLIAVGLTILSVLIFVVALSLRLPLFGPWLRM
jgi:putative tricarboxylic transport membrane protein